MAVKNVDYRCIIHNISKSETINFLKKFFSERLWVYSKNIVLNFQYFQDNLFSLFLFSIYKLVDSMDIYKPLNINIGTVMKNPGMLTFVLDHLKTKKLCKHAVKK